MTMDEDELSTLSPLVRDDTQSLAGVLRNARKERYQTTAEVARGGMGVVERVVDRPLSRLVARKRARGDVGAQPLAQMLVREARVTAWLSHPNVVPVHDLDVDEAEDVFFTMRFVGGRTLEDWIRERGRDEPLDWNTLLDQLDVIVRICDALAFAHERGVLHCDLKPSNIMVGQFGEVYLMDWGVARLLAALPGDAAPDNEHFPEGIVVGTAAYMAPEQAFGLELSAGADIFSVGALLYHIVTGRPPYSASDGGKTIGKARAAEARSPRRYAPWLPPALERIIVTAMARLPEDRFASVAELRNELTRFIRGGGVFDTTKYETDEAIVRQGEVGDLAFVIETGRVRVEVDGENVREMGPGEVFGEMAIIESKPRSASVIATEPTTVRAIPAAELLGELEATKPWLGALVRSLARRAAENG